MHTIRFIACFALATLCARPASAQVNMAALQDAHNTVNASRHLPTFLGDHFNKFQISILNPYAGVGSNFASYQDARDLLQADQLSSNLIGTTLGDVRATENTVAGSLDLSIVNAAVNIRNRQGKKLFTIGAGVNERIEVSGSFNRELLMLAAYGNRQYAGQSVNVMPRFNGMAFTEWYVAGSMNLAPAHSEIIIRPAIRLSYLSAQAGVQMRKENVLNLLTEAEGRHLDFGLSYRINAAVGVDSLRLEGNSFTLNERSLRGGSGSGFGMDLAVRVSPMSGLSFNFGMMDIGSVSFKKSTINIYNNGSSYRYEGTTIDFGGNSKLDLDSVAALVKPNYTYDRFRMALPTKLLLSASYGLKPHTSGSTTWYSHQLSFLYLQGFDNYLTATKRPHISAGYTHSVKNILNVGLNVGVGGIYGASIGALASLKLGALRIGINSNNVLALMSPSAGRGADGGILLALAF